MFSFATDLEKARTNGSEPDQIRSTQEEMFLNERRARLAEYVIKSDESDELKQRYLAHLGMPNAEEWNAGLRHTEEK